jgi:hypothetical protein
LNLNSDNTHNLLHFLRYESDGMTEVKCPGSRFITLFTRLYPATAHNWRTPTYDVSRVHSGSDATAVKCVRLRGILTHRKAVVADTRRG